MRTRRWPAFISVALLAIGWSLARSFLPAVAQVAPSTSTPSGRVLGLSTPIAEAATSTPQVTSTAISAASLQTIDFPQAAGLASLDSYQSILKITFKGTKNGSTFETTDIYTRTFSREPSAQFSIIQSHDQDGQPLQMVSGSIGTTRYSRLGMPGPCMVAVGQSAAQDEELDPATLLIPVRKGQAMGQEVVDGVPARHYAVDTRSFANTGGAEINGDVWLAESGGVVVKYSLRVKAGELFFGKGIQGERTLDFQVVGVGARLPISPPAGCPPPTSDLPAVADAHNIERTPWGVSYTTLLSLADVAEFYVQQMQTLGWTNQSSQYTDLRKDKMIFVNPKDHKILFIEASVTGSTARIGALVFEDTAAKSGQP